MSNKHDIRRNACQLFGGQAKLGYDWWWHSFTGYHKETGEARPFFIEFFACNPASGREAPVLGQLPEHRANGTRPSYVMVKAGSWGADKAQLHRFYGWKEAGVRVSMGTPFSVNCGENHLTETETRGSIRISKEDAAAHPEWMCDAGSMRWNLKIEKKITFNVGYGASGLFRKLQLFEMFWHAEGIQTFYEGSVFWNDEEYVVRKEDCFGYADKNWGKNFTSPWVWLSSCSLTSLETGKKLEHSAFDIGGGRPKIGPVALDRKLLSQFTYEGRDYEFNFSKFWTFCRTKFSAHETEDQVVWHVEQTTLTDRMITDVICKKKDMLLVNYEAPNGEKRHNRLWNGGNGTGVISLYHRNRLVDRVSAENIGCEYGEWDSGDGSQCPKQLPPGRS